MSTPSIPCPLGRMAPQSPANAEELRAMRKGVTAEKLITRSQKLSNYFYLHGMFIFGYPLNENAQADSSFTIKQRCKHYIKFFKKYIEN